MTTMLHPDVLRQLVALRETVPELTVLTVTDDGEALVAFVDDYGERMEMLVPVQRPDRPH